MTSPRVLYPGTFDPVTLGHLDLIRRGLDLFGSVLVAVADNPAKQPLFPAEERVAMLRAEVAGMPVEVERFRGLVVEFARARQIRILLRGVRTIADFEFEYQMAMTNRELDPGVDTAFIMPSAAYASVSSRLIKEVYANGGELRRYLPDRVHALLQARLNPPAPR